MMRKTVRLDESLAQAIALLAKAKGLDFSNALRYSARIGLSALQNPDLTGEEIRDLQDAKVLLEQGKVQKLQIADL